MKNQTKILLLVLTATLLMPSQAFAQGVTIGSMFANFSGSVLAIIKLIKVAAYIIGVFLVVGSIFKFSQLGQGQVQAKTPLIMFFSGIGIFALTGTVSLAMQTMAMGSGPGDILMPSTGGGASTQAAIQGVMLFIRMIGYIAFIRGWLLLNQNAQGKEGTIGRALTHIFGGVAAINVAWTAKMLANTFAPGVPLPF